MNISMAFITHVIAFVSGCVIQAVADRTRRRRADANREHTLRLIADENRQLMEDK